MTPSRPEAGRNAPKVGFRGVVGILLDYFREKAMEQLRSIWFIAAYMVVFQVFLLNLPIVHSITIAAGIAIVVLGLTFFMEGLRLGLMPFGETIGAILPRNSKLPMILAFAFVLGVGAAFAEPAIGILKQAGAGVRPDAAPLLYSLLNDFPLQLVGCVGVGVGLAVALGVLRFFHNWSIKVLIVPIVLTLCTLTLCAQALPALSPVIGLAWDCGAVATGPVTVPLVLALGIGVCRIVGDEESSHGGFGIVSLAALFPVLAVFSLAIWHYWADDYHGRPNYTGAAYLEPAGRVLDSPGPPGEGGSKPMARITAEEFEAYLRTGELSGAHRTIYRGGEITLEDGVIVHRNMEIVLQKEEKPAMIDGIVSTRPNQLWNRGVDLLMEVKRSGLMALQAILPLCLFLFLTLIVVLRERLRRADEIVLGICFALVGMTLFSLGLTLGLTPLGSQLGSNIPIAFASITPWGMNLPAGPLFESGALGKGLAILFAFFLGYGATLAEPALNALGASVEKTTVGVFRKGVLMQTVAIGVGLGIATGVAELAFEGITLPALLVPSYLGLLVLTVISSEEFVNIAWDSAGVTTGPVTVPLVLAVGLGVGANIPGVLHGFGILAMASVGPIMTVLSVGFIVRRTRREAEWSEVQDEAF